MLPSTQSFRQLTKSQDADGDHWLGFSHGTAYGQEFINAVLFGVNMTPALEATALWKLYQAGESTVQAVRGVDLRIRNGDMVAVMGPSGCGKTTLLNILSGIDEPSSGNVSVNGAQLYGISDNARTDLRAEHFGFIFQDFNLLPVLSAVENVELPLLLLGQSPADARNESLAALGRVGLSDRAHHRPANFREVNNNALRWLVQSYTSLRSFSVMNPLAIWIHPLQKR